MYEQFFQQNISLTNSLLEATHRDVHDKFVAGSELHLLPPVNDHADLLDLVSEDHLLKLGLVILKIFLEIDTFHCRSPCHCV